MIKIVGRDESAVLRTTCRSCAAVLEYTPGDLQSIKHSYDYLGGYEVAQGFKCPNCGHNVFPRRY